MNVSPQRLTRALAGLVAAMSIVMVAGCGGSSGSASGGGLTKMRYLMPFPPSGGEADMYFAKKQGYFADQGLDVTIMPGKDSQTAVNQVATGGADIAVVAVKDQLINAAKGQKTVAVGNRQWRGTTGVFAPKDGGIKDLADLDGKQVLHSTASIADLLRTTMTGQQLDASKVEFATISPAALASTFVNGKGDALLTAVPGYKSLVDAERPSNVLLLEDYGLVLPSYVFVVSPDFLKKHPDRVKDFLTAAYRGETNSRKDPKAAAAAMTADNPALKPSVSQAQLGDWTEFICGKQATEQHLPISAMPQEEYQAGIDLLARLGLLGGTVNAADILDADYANLAKQKC